MTEQNIWGPIDIDHWEKAPHLRDRDATEEDVENGLATFYIQGTVMYEIIATKAIAQTKATIHTSNVVRKFSLKKATT